MDYQTEVTTLKDLLSKAKDVLIVTHEHPTFDSIGSSLSLYLGLISLGKKVTIACPDPITVGLGSFVGANKLQTEFSKNNFVISLDYVEGSIEKVSYNIDHDKFNLVVEHRTGFEPFSSEKVHYSYASVTADLIIAVDTIHLGGLKKLYESQKELFASKPIVNIDRRMNNAMFGTHNIVDTQAVTTAEVVAQILSGLGVKLTADIATNLLNALTGATDGFQSSHTTAAVLEIAAVCMRAGGKRFGIESPAQSGGGSTHTDVVVSQTPSSVPIVSVPTQSDSSAVSPKQMPPADWLKPKIFKSTNIS